MKVAGFIGIVIGDTIILSIYSFIAGRPHSCFTSCLLCESSRWFSEPLYDDNKMINSEYESNSHKVTRLFIVSSCVLLGA